MLWLFCSGELAVHRVLLVQENIEPFVEQPVIHFESGFITRPWRKRDAAALDVDDFEVAVQIIRSRKAERML